MPRARKMRRSRQREVPSSLTEWLDKWEPKISGLQKRSKSQVSGRAAGALDELEFLLARTVENQVEE